MNRSRPESHSFRTQRETAREMADVTGPFESRLYVGLLMLLTALVLRLI
jgi:hypothetical protein